MVRSAYVDKESKYYGKVSEYIIEKGEVSRVELQRHFSHRLTAKELDEILCLLEKPHWPVVGEYFEFNRGTWTKPKITYFDAMAKFFGRSGPAATREKQSFIAKKPGSTSSYPHGHLPLAHPPSKLGEALKKIADKALDPKYIKHIRLHPGVLKLYIYGFNEYEIADQLDHYSPLRVRITLKSDGMQRQIKEVERRIEKEMVKAIVAPHKQAIAKWKERALRDPLLYLGKELNEVHI